MEKGVIDDLLKQATIEDIPETHQPVVKLIGIEAFIKLCGYSSGDQLYFPMQDTIIRKIRNRIISAEYTGSNMRELAIKYGLTIRQISTAISISKKSRQSY